MTRGGRGVKKSEFWGDVIYGWSLNEMLYLAITATRNAASRQFEQADSPLGCLLFEMASAFPEMILFNRKGKFLALLKKKSMGK